jgi:hypothetical protein
MEWYDVASFLIRASNAALWLVIGIHAFRWNKPLSRFGRRIVWTVIAIGMIVLAVGGLVPMGIISGQFARVMYTAFTAYAAIVALALLSTETRDLI